VDHIGSPFFVVTMPEMPLQSATRVLVVDDEPIMREMLRMMFDRNPDFDIVTTCRSAEECVAVVLDSDVELVLLDLGLPDSSGSELVSTLRQIASRIRIVVVSGRDDAATVDDAMNAGADGYVVKGDPQRIVAGMKRVMAGVRVVDLGRAAL
jgi:DNA-binding NarL/FixJ family response regulator